MSEVLLETLVEKFVDHQKQAQEIRQMIEEQPDHSPVLSQIGQRIDGIETEIKEIPGRISIPESALLELKNELRRHRLQLEKPLQQEVRHHHHVSKPLLACCILAGIVIMLAVFLILAWEQGRQHRDADVKYRYLKLSDDPGMMRDLDDIDSLYLADPDRMRKGVTQEEDRRQADFERREKLEEKKAEVRELEGEGAGRP